MRTCDPALRQPCVCDLSKKHARTCKVMGASTHMAVVREKKVGISRFAEKRGKIRKAFHLLTRCFPECCRVLAHKERSEVSVGASKTQQIARVDISEYLATSENRHKKKASKRPKTHLNQNVKWHLWHALETTTSASNLTLTAALSHRSACCTGVGPTCTRVARLRCHSFGFLGCLGLLPWGHDDDSVCVGMVVSGEGNASA